MNGRTANLGVPVYVVVFQIGAVALAVLVGVSSLALSRQSFELAVLRSRGFSRRKLLVAQAVQVVVVTVAAYPLGLLIGEGLALVATHANGSPPPGTRTHVAIPPAALLAGAVAAVVAAVVLFVLPLGIAAFYEVKTRGFLPATQSGSLDPLIVLAPTLLIFAASFLVLRLLLYVLRGLERPMGATRSLAAYLAGRRLGRSPGTSFAISLLLVLAVGLLVVSTTYRATVIRNHLDTAHQEVGADWLVNVGPPSQQLPAAHRLPSGTTAVIRTEAALQPSTSEPPTALAIDPTTYPSGGWWRSDYSSLSEGQIMSDLRVPDPGRALPPDAGRLTVRYAFPPGSRGSSSLQLAAVFEGADGSVLKRTLGPLDRSSGSLSASTSGARRLLSIVVRSSAITAPKRIVMRLSASVNGGSGRSIPLVGWSALRWRNSSGTVTPAGSAARVSLETGLGNVVAGIVPPQSPIPALLPPDLASQYGPQFEAEIGGQTLSFRSIGQAAGFPSVVGGFVVMPLRTLILDSEQVGEPSLAINEVWGMGPDPRSELHAAGFVPAETQEAAKRAALFSQLPQSLAVGMQFTAAAGGMGLVVIGVAVGLYFTQRRREFEFASLRAMGSGSGQISRVLLAEQVAMVGFAVVAGTALGFAVVRLMMPYFGKSLGANFPAPLMAVDWRSLGVYVAAIALATAAALLLSLRALMSASVTSVLRGEAE